MHNKHVICEKPFTSNVNELDELIALAKQQNCLLFEAITNQYLPTFKEIKEKYLRLGKSVLFHLIIPNILHVITLLNVVKYYQHLMSINLVGL